MPIIKTENSELLNNAVCFAQQLKCEVKDGKIKVNDLARIDLFTEMGIRRQILLLSGHYKGCDYVKKVETHLSKSVSPKSCFEINFGDNLTLSKFATQEYLDSVNHYFGRKIQLLVSGGSLFCESKSLLLASFFYRAILTDISDYFVDFNKVKFFASEEILKEVLSIRKPLFLSCDKIINDFGNSIPEEDIATSLRKFGYKIISFTKGEGYLILPPFFRSDIYSESDILEDIMICNLEKFEGNKNIKIRRRNNCNSNHNSHKETIIAKELLNFGFKELCLPSHKGLPLATSIEKDYLFRSSIIPSLLDYEVGNQYKKYPHKLFEVGIVIDGSKQNEKLGILISETKVDFNELYSIIHYIFLVFFEKKIYLEESDSKYYEKGASFDIIENNNKIGTIGILSLKFAKEIKLRKPCVCSEINL